MKDAKSQSIHQHTGIGVEYILKNSLLRRTLDNVTVVQISFSNFEQAVAEHNDEEEWKDEDREEVMSL